MTPLPNEPAHPIAVPHYLPQLDPFTAVWPDVRETTYDTASWLNSSQQFPVLAWQL